MANPPQQGSFRHYATRLVKAAENTATQLERIAEDLDESKEQLIEIKEMIREWYTDWKASG